MPDVRHHRGPHPEDGRLFAPDRLPDLRSAVADLSWLLTRDYASPSALKIVGDRYNLTQRQRIAVMRCVCSDQALHARQSRQVAASDLLNEPFLIDGYNLLTTIEAALARGVILIARDQCYRDMASIHGTYRKVEETIPALDLAGKALADLAPASCLWLLDSPVSNSGRLKTIILDTAARQNYNWQVDLILNPDRDLMQSEHIIATADSVVLDGCQRWFNLARHIVSAIPDAWIIDLSTP